MKVVEKFSKMMKERAGVSTLGSGLNDKKLG